VSPGDGEKALNEEPHEPFVLDFEVVERLHTQLALSTSGFSVEQLENVGCIEQRGLWLRLRLACIQTTVLLGVRIAKQ
jgi:hypothetical protein